METINQASLPRYDRSQTYRWNYDHAPDVPDNVDVAPVPGQWTFCGRRVPSPLGIPAGPLLNGRWILYYAALGFDVLTYKTTRSAPRECYPLPNLVPVQTAALDGGERSLPFSDVMDSTWAVSFGMPSMEPGVWQADVEWTRRHLPREKILVVSVVASAQPDWTLDDLAADYARCARWAAESGADCVEVNFSCPNVATRDGQLYQQADAAGLVAQQVRDAISSLPLIIKIGHLTREPAAAALLEAIAPAATAISMTNCLVATVAGPDGPLFGGQARGIGGEAIRPASVNQVRLFANLIRERRLTIKLIGVGGIFTAAHAREYLAAGAESVQLATAAMLDPLVGCQIRRALAHQPPVQPD
jgi:dihydroorotate dehydrogenase